MTQFHDARRQIAALPARRAARRRRVEGAFFSPDGHRLVVATTGESFPVWDAEGWEQVLTLSVPGARFASFGFSPDGNLLGAMNVFGQFHLWRAPSWTEIEAAEKGGPVP